MEKTILTKIKTHVTVTTGTDPSKKEESSSELKDQVQAFDGLGVVSKDPFKGKKSQLEGTPVLT